MNKWYRFKTKNEIWYSPFTKYKINYSYSGDGSKAPTPKEIADFRNNHQDYYYDDGCFYEYDKEDFTGIDLVNLPNDIYMYQNKNENKPERIEPLELRKDSYIEFSHTYKQLEDDITKFLNNKKIYKENGFIYKNGYLLYGPPGQSKTVTVRRLINKFFNKKAIVIFFDATLPSTKFFTKLKETINDKLKIFIFEELTCATGNRDIDKFLSFLDGEFSTDNTIVLATTNYPEKLPGNIVDRPSRFDKLYRFDNPNSKEREILISTFLKREATKAELEESKELSVADLKEICLNCLIEKTDNFSYYCKIMKDRKQLCKKAFAKSASVGFGSFSQMEFDL